MRSCRSCAETKRLPEFRGGRSDCRACERAACREYAAANKPGRNARLARWRRENPHKAAAVDRRKKLKANYGLTEADVSRMHKSQGGRCALCASAGPLVVDHCHDTGRIRGLLCVPCNTFLGRVEANPGWLDRAAAYLGEPCHADVLLELANSKGGG